MTSPARRARTALAVLMAAVVLAAPAFADIKAFNEKVQARDFKAAAAEATATWAELDKSRADIGLIAREFGFAAYLASDYEPAKTWALFAAGHTPEGSDYRMSMVLLRLAELRIAPSKASRDELANALTARAEVTGIDNISYIAADALVGYDFASGKWADTEASSALAAKLAEAGGQTFLDRRRRFQLFAEAAQYMRTKDKGAYFEMVGVVNALAADIDAAPTDEAALRLAPTYWEARAWALSMSSHLKSRKVSLDRVGIGDVPTDVILRPKRASLPQDRADRAACPTRIEFSRTPQYPPSAAFKGFVGTAIIKVDIDAQGMASNPVLLAAIPEEHFGKTVLASVRDMRVKPQPAYDATKCSLAQVGRVIEYVFTFQ